MLRVMRLEMPADIGKSNRSSLYGPNGSQVEAVISWGNAGGAGWAIWHIDSSQWSITKRTRFQGSQVRLWPMASHCKLGSFNMAVTSTLLC